MAAPGVNPDAYGGICRPVPSTATPSFPSMPASARGTYHALVNLPEELELDGWLAGYRLTLWGEVGKGWSEYREPLRSLYGPGEGRRSVAVTVRAGGKRRARAVLRSAVRAVGGTLLSGPLLATATPRIVELRRLTHDLALDGINYLAGDGPSAERADHLAEQSAAVSALVVKLCAAGYAAHPAVTKAQQALEEVTRTQLRRPGGPPARSARG